MVAKGKATRVARNTMGPRQRLKVKGSVIGVVVTPAVGPPSVAPGRAPVVTDGPNK